jgi:hypothetical protein
MERVVSSTVIETIGFMDPLSSSDQIELAKLERVVAAINRRLGDKDVWEIHEKDGFYYLVDTGLGE